MIKCSWKKTKLLRFVKKRNDSSCFCRRQGGWFWSSLLPCSLMKGVSFSPECEYKQRWQHTGGGVLCEKGPPRLWCVNGNSSLTLWAPGSLLIVHTCWTCPPAACLLVNPDSPPTHRGVFAQLVRLSVFRSSFPHFGSWIMLPVFTCFLCAAEAACCLLARRLHGSLSVHSRHPHSSVRESNWTPPGVKALSEC